MIHYSAPDFTQHPPRSPRVRLGGFVHLPRLLDKARAAGAGKLGEFIYPCPLDKRLLDFLGIEAELILSEAKTGKGDAEMLAFILKSARTPRAPYEIQAWSAWLENLSPGDADRHEGFAELIRAQAPARDDIRTMFDRLDIDDYTTYGGKA